MNWLSGLLQDQQSNLKTPIEVLGTCNFIKIWWPKDCSGPQKVKSMFPSLWSHILVGQCQAYRTGCQTLSNNNIVEHIVCLQFSFCESYNIFLTFAKEVLL